METSESRKLCIYGVNGSKNGCDFYRIQQPFSRLAESEKFMCASSSLLKGLDDQTLWTDKADVIVSQIGTSEKFLDYVFDNQGKKKFVLDMDDNLFAVSPYNPAYRQHGISEVEVTVNGEKVMLWEDGKNGFQIKENKARLFLFQEMLKIVDLVTTPSPVLAGVFKKKGAKNVKVIKNFIDFKVWKPLRIVKDEFVRIGYQGGWSHYEDWCEIKDVMLEIMQKHKNVKLIIMGQHYEGTLKGIEKERIEVEPWMPVEIYPWKWKTLNIDIGIAPLKQTEFSICKSELKWEEYGALSIPCIASNIPPYNLAIEHGKTGLLASSQDEWFDYLDQMITSANLREKLGQQAMEKVKASYDIDKEVEQYEKAYAALFKPEVLVV